jgi:hypothetical protein
MGVRISRAVQSKVQRAGTRLKWDKVACSGAWGGTPPLDSPCLSSGLNVLLKKLKRQLKSIEVKELITVKGLSKRGDIHATSSSKKCHTVNTTRSTKYFYLPVAKLLSICKNWVLIPPYIPEIWVQPAQNTHPHPVHLNSEDGVRLFLRMLVSTYNTVSQT